MSRPQKEAGFDADARSLWVGERGEEAPERLDGVDDVVADVEHLRERAQQARPQVLDAHDARRRARATRATGGAALRLFDHRGSCRRGGARGGRGGGGGRRSEGGVDGAQGGAHGLEREAQVAPVARLRLEHRAHQRANQCCEGERTSAASEVE